MKRLLSVGITILCAVIFVEQTHLCFGGNLTSGICIEEEREALLKLKLSFEDPSNRLASWSGEDCCAWRGVRCHTSTGHVVHLDLRTPLLSPERLSSQQIGYSLADLKHLEYLDLSGNDFNQSQIPEFFGLFTYLTYLDISFAGFGGKITHQLRNLTNLEVIDLSDNYGVYADDFQWASSLSSLRILDMSYLNLSKALDLIPTLSKLSSLLQLQLNGCGIRNTHFSVGSINSTFLARIQSLALARNNLWGEILGHEFNDFSGEVPNVIRNMTALRQLDLAYQERDGFLVFGGFKSENMHWISRLSSLQYLDISGADFSKSYNLFQALNRLPSLLSLKLARCGIQTINVSQATINFTLFSRLQYLDLGHNEISGPLSDALIKNMSTVLKELGPSLWLGNHLRHLDLSYNLLSGPIPPLIGGFKLLSFLDLSNNQLTGTIPLSITRLSALISLDLSSNQIGGTIPQSFGSSFPFLESLYLSYNHLNGSIPHSLGQLSTLQNLYLSYNTLSGTIPISLGRLPNLLTLDISSNSFEAIISDHHFTNLSKLKSLRVGSTNLTWKVKSNWVPPFSLKDLDMSSCKIGPEFPQWLQTQKALQRISLSNAGISGSLPRWLFYIRHLQHLDLSMNLISEDPLARLFDAIPFIRTLLLNDNLISGSIPSSLCKLERPYVLDFSRNNISGEIPNCFRISQMVVMINFSYNKLFGKIPNSLGHLPYLKRFLANSNTLDGVVPLGLRNCTSLEILDLGGNKLSGSIPTWIGESLSSLRVLRLHKNMLVDSIPLQLCKLSNLQILDLSENNLDGKIPRCFGNLTAMTIEGNIATLEFGDATMLSYTGIDPDDEWKRVKVMANTKGLYNLEFSKTQLQLLDLLDLSKNKLVGAIPDDLCLLHGLRSLKLSHNLLSGRIPKKIGDLKLLDTLDLSNNKLSGEIPPSMSLLPYISHLNLSNNNFSGKIPKGNQLQTLNDPSIYGGNIKLCGDPLPKKCPDHNDHSVQNIIDEYHEDEAKEKIWFWSVVIAGYTTGFWVVIGSFAFKRKWRIAYFRFADHTKEKLIVMFAVNVAKFKMMMNHAFF